MVSRGRAPDAAGPRHEPPAARSRRAHRGDPWLPATIARREPPAAGPRRASGSARRSPHRAQPVHDARGRLGAGRRGAGAAHRRCPDVGAARGADRRRGSGGGWYRGDAGRRRRAGGHPCRARGGGGAGVRRDAQGAPRSARTAVRALCLGVGHVLRGFLHPGARGGEGRIPQARVPRQPVVRGAGTARERHGRRGVAPDRAAAREECVPGASLRGRGVNPSARFGRRNPAGHVAVDDGKWSGAPWRHGLRARRGRRDVRRGANRPVPRWIQTPARTAPGSRRRPPDPGPRFAPAPPCRHRRRFLPEHRSPLPRSMPASTGGPRPTGAGSMLRRGGGAGAVTARWRVPLEHKGADLGIIRLFAESPAQRRVARATSACCSASAATSACPSPRPGTDEESKTLSIVRERAAIAHELHDSLAADAGEPAPASGRAGRFPGRDRRRPHPRGAGADPRDARIRERRAARADRRLPGAGGRARSAHALEELSARYTAQGAMTVHLQPRRRAAGAAAGARLQVVAHRGRGARQRLRPQRGESDPGARSAARPRRCGCWWRTTGRILPAALRPARPASTSVCR